MPRRRYLPSELTPVTRDSLPTYERQDDPAAGRRLETWAAWSACGTWVYLRSEDRGTPWHLRHLPTGHTTTETWSSLDDARHATTRPDVWDVVRDDALWFLRTCPEVTGGPSPVTPHDEARALLTWLADEWHAPRPPASRLDPVTTTG